MEHPVTRNSLAIDDLLQVAFGNTDATLERYIGRRQQRDPGHMLHVPDFWLDEDIDLLTPREASTGRALSTLFWEIDLIGRTHDRDGRACYRRFAWTDEDAWLRIWFAAQAQRVGCTIEVDNAGNQWAWLNKEALDTGTPALVVGSHLDSVPDGGPFDGPLGVLSAIVAVNELRSGGWKPTCPFAIVNFHDEEGARFAIACLGSRVLTGASDPTYVLKLTDASGETMAAAIDEMEGRIERVRRRAGSARALADFSKRELEDACRTSVAPTTLTPSPELIAHIGAYLELHVEQGGDLEKLDAAVAVADGIWPHGRWRVDISGEANHAGTTPMDERADAVVAFSELVQAVRKAARAHGARATIGKVEVEPNGVNVIASHVRCWIDCRAPTKNQLQEAMDEVNAFTRHMGACGNQKNETAKRGITAKLACESSSPAIAFSPNVRRLLLATVSDRLSTDEVPVVGTGAGHDAGVLEGAHVPCGMLFVRNATGASHTSREHARLHDCIVGVHALEAAIEEASNDLAHGSKRLGNHTTVSDGTATVTTSQLEAESSTSVKSFSIAKPTKRETETS